MPEEWVLLGAEELMALIEEYAAARAESNIIADLAGQRSEEYKAAESKAVEIHTKLKGQIWYHAG